MGSNRKFLEESIPHVASLMEEDPSSLLGTCEVIVMGVRDADVERALATGAPCAATVIDLVGIPHADSLPMRYHGICW
jgi:GDP-mannose 6-dehydrogenase